MKANQLAHHLIRVGVKPETKLAICVARSTNMIVAILGVLKAGGAYVPLDPVYSCQRLNYILNDVRPQCILTDGMGKQALVIHEVPEVDLARLPFTNLPVDDPQTERLNLAPAHLAYIIYTSGSTGLPKGVMVEHQQVTRLLDVTHPIFNFNKKDKWCLFHSFSFDFSVWEIWGALSYGCQWSIPSSDTTRSAHNFHEWACNSNPRSFQNVFAR